MHQAEYDDFKQTISDLCVAVNRPFNDDLARVFWEDLKFCYLSDIRTKAKSLRSSGKRNFSSSDLRPEPEAPQPVNTYEPPPEREKFHANAQRCLLSFVLANDVDEATLAALVFEKNRLMRDFREMDREEPVEPEHIVAQLKRAFERVLTQRAAA